MVDKIITRMNCVTEQYRDKVLMEQLVDSPTGIRRDSHEVFEAQQVVKKGADKVDMV